MSIDYLLRKHYSLIIFLILFAGINPFSQAQTGIVETFGCDSLVLSASITGNSYNWNTSAASSTLTVYQSDTFWVDIDTGTGIVRDSFVVWISASSTTPIVSDTNLCIGENFFLTAISNSDNLVWYKDSISAQSFIETGDSVLFSLVDTCLFLVQGFNYAGIFNTGLPTTGNTTSAGYYSISNERGIMFEVFQPVALRKVTIYANNSFSAVLRIRKGSGVYDTKMVNLVPGANNIVIDQYLLPATDYILTLQPTIGGSLYIDLPFTFPIGNSIVNLKRGFPAAGHHNFFYDWEFSPIGCSSPVANLKASTLPTPNFDLGNDTLICGASAFSLDASYPGSQYVWSTGVTTPTISLTATDSVWAQAAIGNCFFRDSIVVQLLQAPQPIASNDTNVCGPNFYNLLSDSNADQTLWFEDSSINSTAFVSRDTLQIFVSDTTTFYREAVNLSQTTSSGYITPGNTGNGNYYSISNERGLLLQNTDYVILQSATVYANNTFTATVELRDSFGIVIRTTPYQFGPGPNQVELNYYLPPSGKYFLLLTNLSQTASLYIDLPTTFPLIGEDLDISAGFPSGTHYNFFYDLQVARIGCRSGLTPFRVNVLDIPIFDLGPDTLLCGSGPLFLDAFSPRASYLWSTGDTSSQVSLTQSDTISVEVTLESCTLADTIIALISPLPPPPQLSDTFLCGPQTVLLGVSQPGPFTIIWFDDSLSTSQSLFVGDSLRLDVKDSRKIYAQATSTQTEVQAGLDSIGSSSNGGYFPISQDRGLVFDVFEDFILKTVTVYTLGNFTSSIQLSNSNGKVLRSITYSFTPGQNVVSLDFYISQGIDYSLTMVNPRSNIYLDFPVTFPIENEFIRIKRGSPTSSHYNFFYDWKLLPIGCVSEKEPLQIDVALPLSLPDTLYLCQDSVLAANFQAATYSWNTGSMLPQIPIDSSGRYILTVTDNTGCMVMDTTRVGMPRPVELGADGVLCGNNLYSGYKINEGKILWSTGDTTSQVTISQPGSYWVEIEETNGCILRDTIDISGFEIIPTVDLGSDVSACDSIILDAQNTGAMYLWNTGDTTQMIQASMTGSYSVLVTDGTGCVGGDTLNVNITSKPTSFFSFQINPQNPGLVNFFNLSSLGGSPSSISFEWFFGDGGKDGNINATHTYLDSGTYIVKLIVTTNCGTDTFEQVVMIDFPVSIDPLLEDDEFSIYPNPVQSTLHITFKQTIPNPFTIRLYDFHGKLCMQKKMTFAVKEEKVSLDLDALPSGMYFIRFSGGINNSKHIIVKQKNP